MQQWTTRSALVALALLALPGSASALAIEDLLAFPLPAVAGAPDVSDEEVFEPLAKGSDYRYRLRRVRVHNPRGEADPDDPATWTVLSYVGTVTYRSHAARGSYEEVGVPIGDLVLVLTSLRQGRSDRRSGALPPLLQGGYVGDSLADDGVFIVRDPTAASDGSSGAILDAEGGYFLALRFDALRGVRQRFAFDIALREPIRGRLRHFDRGFYAPPYAPIPEPGAGALLAAALALLALARPAQK